MRPLVTIAIALYNNENYIQRCVLSTIQQSYKQLEIIIVNDGSTDTSLEKARVFTDNRIKIINKKNEGLSSARQVALNLSTGEYISFIDGDDYLKPDYVELMLRRIQKDQSDICICGTIFENEMGQRIEHDTNYFHSKDFNRPYSSSGTNVRWLYLSDSWNKLYRVSFLKKSRVEFNIPKGLNGTDRAFNMKTFVHHPLYSSISDQCYIHVIYKKSAVHRKKKNLFKCYCTIIEQVENECEKNGTFNDFIKFLNIHYYLFLRSSYQDIFNENSLWESFRAFHQIQKVHKIFVDRRDYLRHPLMLGTKSNLLFLRLHKNFFLLLPFYFGIRQAVININN